MSRTDVVASPRLQTAGRAPMRKRWSRASRRFLVLPIALLLAVALVAPTAAFAASTGNEGLSGYSQKPKPSSGTSPSTEKSTPKKETAPAKKETAPAKTTTAPTTESAKAKTLPFTGFDLRWTIGAGLLLMGLGFSIVTVQRRQRRDSGS
jgi:hypothetical protein